MELSYRLKFIKPSPTLTLSQKADELKQSGIDIINLTTGEPDFSTPLWICEAADRAMKNNQNKYTAVAGTVDLRRAIQSKFKNQNNLNYELDQIIVSTGGKQVLFNALMASLNPGDEVIIPAPYWVSYVDMVNLFEAKPVIIECRKDQHFKMTPKQLEDAITPKTKWLVFNSPSNPTGAVYSKQELKSIADILVKHPHVHILSDDIYEHLIYGEAFFNLPMVENSLFERTLTVNGVSKTYAMTGWRIGFAGGPRSLIKAMCTLQSQSTTNACSIAQAAAVEALNGPQEFLEDWRTAYKKRRDLMVNGLNAIPGISCLTPAGAFYVYPDCKELIGKKTPEGITLEDDSAIADYFLQNARVAVVPGVAFGLSPHVRLSYAADESLLQEACQRIEASVKKLR